MMQLQRMTQSVFIMATALGDLALWAWLLSVDHGSRWPVVLAAALIGLSPAAITVLFVRHDLLAERGRALGEMASAGYVLVDEDAPITLLWGLVTIPHVRRVWWIDADGDGVVDAGETRPRTTFVQRDRDKPAPTSDRDRARALLQWTYARAREGLPYGQRDRGSEWTRAVYDHSMAILTHVGIIAGRGRQGVKGELVIVPQNAKPTDADWDDAERTALAVFDRNVVDEP